MIIIAIEPDAPVCDFCSSPEVFATHQCEPFTIDKDKVIAQQDCDGLWAACRECDELIKAERWNALYERSVHMFEKKYGVAMPWELCNSLRNLHNNFIATRKKAS